MDPLPSTTRFSSRVADYVKWRPHYPAEIVPVLRREGLLAEGGTVVDVGSGTGISAKLFLEQGHPVVAVEPNAEMRAAAEEWLGGEDGFQSVKGTAEATTLPEGMADLVFCAQAFHWFDREASKREFERILKPGRQVVLCWNNRDETQAFQRDYERALRECLPEYTYVSHKYLTEEEIAAWFAPHGLRQVDLEYHQTFDLKGLKGRLLSSSYCPKDGPAHDAVMRRMEELFEQYAEAGTLRFSYVTNLFWADRA